MYDAFKIHFLPESKRNRLSAALNLSRSLSDKKRMLKVLYTTPRRLTKKNMALSLSGFSPVRATLLRIFFVFAVVIYIHRHCSLSLSLSSHSTPAPQPRHRECQCAMGLPNYRRRRESRRYSRSSFVIAIFSRENIRPRSLPSLDDLRREADATPGATRDPTTTNGLGPGVRAIDLSR